MKTLPDTNVIINALKGIEPDARRLKRIIIHDSLILSVIVVAEFLSKANDEQENEFDQLIRHVEVLPIDERVARQASQYRKANMEKNKRSYLIDCLLAAQAKVHGLTLITNNTSDFPMKGIRIIKP